MFEIENWNGRRVLVIPTDAAAEQDPMIKAYLDAAKSLADDLGVHDAFRRCQLCPMHRANSYQCAHPRGLGWAATTNAVKGGCHMLAIVAEEYIPLVRMRLGEQA